jgi:hypothetical protein
MDIAPTVCAALGVDPEELAGQPFGGEIHRAREQWCDRRSKEARMIAILQFDGASRMHLEQMLAAGYLANLAGLARGSWLELDTPATHLKGLLLTRLDWSESWRARALLPVVMVRDRTAGPLLRRVACT